eukprot:TRINITY_DN11180_c0_g1_i1.p1 TRINITY_DN11180_c0_g1~~TRINITY_DN11180_c0_g1_i1.p1  ORF type:complete len:195 (+),score=11.89 TRINITY_DN11180_c0_g1_i1:1026-1610(+)
MENQTSFFYFVYPRGSNRWSFSYRTKDAMHVDVVASFDRLPFDCKEYISNPSTFNDLYGTACLIPFRKGGELDTYLLDKFLGSCDHYYFYIGISPKPFVTLPVNYSIHTNTRHPRSSCAVDSNESVKWNWVWLLWPVWGVSLGIWLCYCTGRCDSFHEMHSSIHSSVEKERLREYKFLKSNHSWWDKVSYDTIN